MNKTRGFKRELWDKHSETEADDSEASGCWQLQTFNCVSPSSRWRQLHRLMCLSTWLLHGSISQHLLLYWHRQTPPDPPRSAQSEWMEVNVCVFVCVNLSNRKWRKTEKNTVYSHRDLSATVGYTFCTTTSEQLSVTLFSPSIKVINVSIYQSTESSDTVNSLIN